MKVLVTGVAGRIGAAVHDRLGQAHEVVGLDLRPSPRNDLTGSITDPALARRAMRGVEAVVHVAALHAPHVGVHPDAEFVAVNVEGTRSLLAAAREAGVTRWVYTSTTALYGVDPHEPADAARWIDEDTPPRPRTIYHRTKWQAEALLAEEARRGGLAVTVLRMSRCFPEPAPLMAVYRLHRGIDERDVADAHARALVGASPGFRCFIVSGLTPFEREDAPALRQDAPAVLRRRAPGLVEAFARRGWPLPGTIDRVYDARRAVDALGWRPRHGFESVLDAPPA